MLKRKRIKYSAAILYLSALLFVSCAHKSGHRRDHERPSTMNTDRSDWESSRSAPRRNKIMNKHSSDKFEGSQTFKQYDSAGNYCRL